MMTMTKRHEGKVRPVWALVLALACFYFGVNEAQAHYLWFEVDSVVKPNDNIPIKLYFGEYQENQLEARGGRLDERKGTTLHVGGPSGTDLQALPLQENMRHFLGTLSVQEAGIYNLVATDATSPVVDYTKFDIGIVRPIFYARTWLLSFQPGGVSERALMPQPVLDLDILPVTRHLDVQAGVFGPKVDEETVFRVIFKGKPLTDRAVINIYAPNGWLWEAKIDADGLGRFTPLWPGIYVIDVVYLEKTPGEFKEKAYEAIRHRSTLTLKAHEGDR